MFTDLTPLLTSAENILSKTFNSPLQLHKPSILTEPERNNRIIRVQLKNPPSDAPNSLIIKQASPTNYNPNTLTSNATQGLFNDWAGIEFLSELPNAETKQYCPRFYGGNRNKGFIIMEDLGTDKKPLLWNGQEHQENASLVQPLLQETAVEAEISLIKLGQCLGQMHAATVSQVVAYEKIRNRLGPNINFGRNEQAKLIRDFAEKCPVQFKQLNLTPPLQFYNELEALANVIQNPGPFLAYTHGDPCPDNCSYIEGHFRLHDFERGDFRHALLDAVYGRISFPTCWCCHWVPSAVVKTMETVYRTELIKGCPAAEEDSLFEQGLVEACAFWTVWVMESLPDTLKKDQQWGIATIRQRILARLKIMADTANEFNHLPAIAYTTTELSRKLHQIWSNIAELPVYPAFNTY